MINIKDSYATLWQVEDKGTYIKCRLSTAKKNKQTGEYENSSGYTSVEDDDELPFENNYNLSCGVS